MQQCPGGSDAVVAHCMLREMVQRWRVRQLQQWGNLYLYLLNSPHKSMLPHLILSSPRRGQNIVCTTVTNPAPFSGLIHPSSSLSCPVTTLPHLSPTSHLSCSEQAFTCSGVCPIWIWCWKDSTGLLIGASKFCTVATWFMACLQQTALVEHLHLLYQSQCRGHQKVTAQS